MPPFVTTSITDECLLCEVVDRSALDDDGRDEDEAHGQKVIKSRCVRHPRDINAVVKGDKRHGQNDGDA